MSVNGDELMKEFDFLEEGLHTFIVRQEGNLCNCFDLVRVYLNPTFGNDVAQDITLEHCENTLFEIKGYLILMTSLKSFHQMVYVVRYILTKHHDIIEVDHHALSNRTMELSVHCELKCCTRINQPKWNSLKCEHSPVCVKYYF